MHRILRFMRSLLYTTLTKLPFEIFNPMMVTLHRHIFQRDLYYYYTNRVLKLVAVLGLAPTS